MLQKVIEARRVAALGVAAVVGVLGLSVDPFPRDELFLALIAIEAPAVFRLLSYARRSRWRFHLVAHLARVDGLRVVTEVIAVEGYDANTDRFRVGPLFSAAGATREGVIA